MNTVSAKEAFTFSAQDIVFYSHPQGNKLLNKLSQQYVMHHLLFCMTSKKYYREIMIVLFRISISFSRTNVV